MSIRSELNARGHNPQSSRTLHPLQDTRELSDTNSILFKRIYSLEHEELSTSSKRLISCIPFTSTREQFLECPFTQAVPSFDRNPNRQHILSLLEELGEYPLDLELDAIDDACTDGVTLDEHLTSLRLIRVRPMAS